MKVEANMGDLLAAGGRYWLNGEQSGYHRVYFTPRLEEVGLDVNFHDSGNVSKAWFRGEVISTAKANDMLKVLYHSRVYYDLDAEELRADRLWDNQVPELYRAVLDSVADRIRETRKFRSGNSD